MASYAVEYPTTETISEHIDGTWSGVKVAVVGNGCVGLPLCVLINKGSHQVTGFDLSVQRAARHSAGNSTIAQVEDSELAGIAFTNNPVHIQNNDVYVICVPTPQTHNQLPDLKFVFQAKEIIKAHAKPGALIILESAVGVGNTRRIFHDVREGGMLVAYSPERIHPSRKFPTLPDIPKVVGGIDPKSTAAAFSFYRTVFNSVLPVNSSDQAEAIKLLEDSYHAINTSFTNIFFGTANLARINVSGRATSDSYGFFSSCSSNLVENHSILVNQHHPNLMRPPLSAATNFLNALPERETGENFYARNLRRVLVCGVSCQPDVSDIKNAKQVDFVRTLEEIGVIVEFYDPLVKQFEGLERIDDLSGVKWYDKVFVFHQHSVCKAELEMLRHFPNVEFYC